MRKGSDRVTPWCEQRKRQTEELGLPFTLWTIVCFQNLCAIVRWRRFKRTEAACSDRNALSNLNSRLNSLFKRGMRINQLWLLMVFVMFYQSLLWSTQRHVCTTIHRVELNDSYYFSYFLILVTKIILRIIDILINNEPNTRRFINLMISVKHVSWLSQNTYKCGILL